MEETNWEIQISSIDGRFDSNVYIYRFLAGYTNQVEWLEFKTPEVIIHRETHTYGQDTIKPAFTCPHKDAIGISKAFLTYANSQGFKNSSETFSKGKLEATERHLEDMRKIVFEPIIYGKENNKT